MNWLLDRLALLLAAVACGGAAWAIIRYSGQWIFPSITIIAVVALFAENARLRARLRALGKDPNERPRRHPFK
ncbi:hypothetical protein [Paraburkholderia caffeinilytica]|uniref:hypothetical protein n=1 Tax=Paraburkholderia caffeinilytica TaxID=1761016 RepID=UPI003D9FE490